MDGCFGGIQMVAILHFTLQWREVQFRKDVSDGGGLWLQVQVYINLFLYLPPSHLHVGGSCNSVMVGNKNSS